MQLDDDTNERINCWARLVTTLLDTGLAEDKLPLVDWVSNSLQKGDIQFDEQQLTTLCSLDVPLPLDSTALHERLNTARVVHKTPSFHDALLRIWIVVRVSPVQLKASYDTVFATFKLLENVTMAQLSTPTSNSLFPGSNAAIMQSLERHWKQPYVGPSCDLLGERIRAYEKEFSSMDSRDPRIANITPRQ